MIHLFLIGIGMGNPDHLTGNAINALQNADLIMIPDKGLEKSDLGGLRKEICDKLLYPLPQIISFDLPVRDTTEPDYITSVKVWHNRIGMVWARTINDNLPKGGNVALMIWGDPSLYDSSLRIAENLKLCITNLEINVIPGITAIQLLTAAHKIPLNNLGEPVILSTGRQLRTKGWPKGCETLVVMLDGETSFDQLDSTNFKIWWGAFLGMQNQILIAGRLDKSCKKIKKTREIARKKHGWIMDTYLLRKIKKRGRLCPIRNPN